MVDNNLIKIAQVACTFPPYRGGMGNVAFHLADHLSQLKYEVTVFAPKFHVADIDIKSYFKIIKLWPQFKHGNSAVILQLFFYLLKFNVTHLHYPFLGASLSFILAKLVRGKKQKFILHYHMDLVGRSWKAWVYKIYNAIFLWPLVALADTVLVTSQDYLETSLIYGLYKKYSQKFQVLPNGVNIDYFKPKPKEFQLISRYNLSDKKIILFVGALDSSHYFKGVNYLLKAFEILNRADTALIIVGEGDLKSVYQNLAESFGLGDKVIFTGYIPDEELVRYYNLCDIFVLPSVDKTEAFGMVLLEAMACGKPVIGTDLPGVRKVVQREINGRLVKPKNSQQLAYKLNLLLNDKNMRVAYGQNGRAIVEKEYSWINITKRLIEIYNLPQ